MSRHLWTRQRHRRLLLTASRRPGVSQRRVRPCLEALEGRIVPTVFNVEAGDVLGLIADITAANINGQASNTVNLGTGVYDLTAVNNFWYGPDGLPPISSNLIIHGNGATIRRDPSSGTPNFRLFYVSGGMELTAGSLTMDNVTLQNGLAKGGDSNLGGGGLGAGGAIFNQGTLNLTDVTLANNEALGGSSGVTALGTNATGGGGMGGNARTDGSGGGFGGSLAGGPFGGSGGPAGTTSTGGGGGGGFVKGANGASGTASSGGSGGGLGGFSSNFLTSFPSDGGNGSIGNGVGGVGGGFGLGGGGIVISGGTNLLVSGAGGGGVGGGGGGGSGAVGGNGGFGGGGGFSQQVDGGTGGFGGGNGGSGSVSGGGGAGMGGALFNMGADSVHPGSGQATLVNCTLTANTAQGGSSDGFGLGGALFNLDGHATLTNDTLAGNTVRTGAGTSIFKIADGGAVFNLAFGNDIDTGSPVAASLVLRNSILADSIGGHDLNSQTIKGQGVNTATGGGSKNLVMTSTGAIGAGVISLTADPDLGPLQNNGGPTQTMLPSAGSPALGAGDPSFAPAGDQRGQPRPPNGPTDLGAVQVSPASNPGGGSGLPGSPHAPVGQLQAFGFGFVNNQLEIFFVDQKGQIFDEAFTLNNFLTPNPAGAQFLNTDLVLRNLSASDALGYPAALGDLVDGNNQDLLMITIPLDLMSPAALQDVLAALQASGA